MRAGTGDMLRLSEKHDERQKTMSVSSPACHITSAAATSEGAPSGREAAGCNDVAYRRVGRAREHSWTCPCLLGASARLEKTSRQQTQSHSRHSQALLRCSFRKVAGHLAALHEFGDVCRKSVVVEVVAETGAYCARLSDRENALLQYGQT